MLPELLRQQADALERLEQEQKIRALMRQQRSTVEFVNRFIEARSSKCISDVAKLL